MKRKWVAVGGVILVSLLLTSVASATKQIIAPDNVKPIARFSLFSYIDMTYDGNQTAEPLDPMGTPRMVTLNISYWVAKGLLGQLILWYCTFIHKTITMSIEVVEKPGFCTTNLSTTQLVFPVSDVATFERMNLTIAVNEYAPVSPFMVRLRLSVAGLVGPFGFFGLVKGQELTLVLFFIVGYRYQIVVTPDNTNLETLPGTPVTDPINVTNLGNSIIRVVVDFIEVPQNWTVSITPPQMELLINESLIMNLSIASPLEFYGDETIHMSFTPQAYPYQPGYEGPPTFVNITVNVRQ